jgi:hypothetical protein
MNNGDDINNLLRTLGHDAGIYQDLAQYNASRAALRRAAMVRPADAAAPAPQPPGNGISTPPVLRVVQPPVGGSSSLSSILNRLASPHTPATADGRETGVASRVPHAPNPSTPQPARLDQLFGRLVARKPGSTER